MDSSYECFNELKDDVSSENSSSGDYFHVYLYSLDSDLEPHEYSHKKFEAVDD